MPNWNPREMYAHELEREERRLRWRLLYGPRDPMDIPMLKMVEAELELREVMGDKEPGFE